MKLRELILDIGGHFAKASTEALASHPLAGTIRSEVPAELKRVLGDSGLTFAGSPGQGNWAEIPWMGIFHHEITESATRGFYVVYLFAIEASEVYLCLGQGVTQLRSEFREVAEDEMLRRAALIRDRVPEYAARFVSGPISLGGSTRLARDYDAAVAFYRNYAIGDLPSEEELEGDLRQIVNLYQLLVGRGGTDNVDTAIELNPDGIRTELLLQIEERRRYVRHVRIERSSRASSEAKRIHGFICQGCGFNFERFYGIQGRQFIEAHHLIPLYSLLEGHVVAMDPRHDFAVLCANCHRMVHRGSPCLTISELRSLPGMENLSSLLAET